MHPAQHVLHVLLVPPFGGPQKVVVPDFQPVPQALEGVQAELVHETLRGLPGVGRRLGDLLAVFVGADLEIHLVAGEAVVAGQGVGQDLLEDVPNVRRAVGVVDGGGDVEGFLRVGHGGASSGSGCVWGQKNRAHCFAPRS